MLDLNENYEMVTKIVKSKFHRYHYDLDDLVQDVCVKIHRQNLGDNPYNPDKSSVSSYVYMVAQGIVTKAWGRGRKDPISQSKSLEAIFYEKPSEKDHLQEMYLKSFEALLQEESEDLADIFDLMLSGFSRREIANLSPYTEHQIRKGRAKMQEIFQQSVN